MSKRAKIEKLFGGEAPYDPEALKLINTKPSFELPESPLKKGLKKYPPWTSADVGKRVTLLTEVALRLREIGYGEGTKDPGACRALLASELIRTGVVMLRQRHRVDLGQHRIAFSVNGWTHDELIEKLGEAW